MSCDFDSYPYRVTTYARQMIIPGEQHHRTLPGDTLPPAEHGPLGQQPARVPCGAFRDSGKQGPAYRGKVTVSRSNQSFNNIWKMDIKSTARERLKAYLDGLSEKQRRGILVAMLAFTCIASGIVLLRAAGRLTPARERMELPFGEGSLTDTLRRLPDPLKGQVTSIYRTIKQPQQNGKQEK